MVFARGEFLKISFKYRVSLLCASWQNGGAVWSEGEVTFLGGNFYRNYAGECGGVLFLSEGGSATLTGGIFQRNKALDGGSVYVHEEAALFVSGGIFSDNKAVRGGGAFFVHSDGNIEVRL